MEKGAASPAPLEGLRYGPSLAGVGAAAPVRTKAPKQPELGTGTRTEGRCRISCWQPPKGSQVQNRLTTLRVVGEPGVPSSAGSGLYKTTRKKGE